MSSSVRRVVITGLGVISPLGNTPETVWDALASRRSGIHPFTTFDASTLPTSFGGEIAEFTGGIDDFGSVEGDKKKQIRKNLKVMCRETQMGVAAAQRAYADAGIKDGSFDPERGGVVFGSDYMLTWPEDFTLGIQKCTDANGRFDFSQWGTVGLGEVTPLWLLKYLPNMPASHVAIFNDLRGPNNSLTLREAASNLAIGEAYRTIARDSADFVLGGATGTRVHPMKVVHSCTQEEVAANGVEPTKASRPFDLNRSGAVLGEGSGVIMLEELENAQKRGAKIYGEIVGFASSSVYKRVGAGDRKTALVNAMKATLNEAGIAPSAVGHVHAHGLSTKSSDAAEAAAIREVFGDTKVPVTAAKSYFGNLGAGGGAVEAIASILALKAGTLFPILNYETPDPECRVNAVTSTDTPAGDNFLNLSVTPQGQASVIMIRTYK